MSIPVQLQQFKAAGIYRIVYDKSTVLAQDSEVLRLVVGYSPKGPFNTPVYIKSTGEFKSTFGDISKTLEKRGCFFHRSALQALEAGPILCLNLKKFADETVGIAHIDAKAVDATKTIAVKDIYDTSRFWELSPSKLNEKIDADNAANAHYLHICAIDSKETSNSFFIRKPSGRKVSSYNVTVNDWYTTLGEEIPEFLADKKNRLISDFFAEVYVFKGKFTPEQVLASDSLSRYFENVDDELQLMPYVENAFGDKVDTLDALYEEETAAPLGHYIGSLIPYFMDSTTGYKALDILFNQDSDVHSMMMAFNEDMLYEGSEGADIIDLSGISEVKDIVAGKTTSTVVLGNESDTVVATICEVDDEIVTTYSSEDPIYDSSISKVDKAIAYKILSVGDAILNADGDDVVYVQSIDSEADYDDAVVYSGEIYADADYVIRVDSALNKEIGTLKPYCLEGYTYAENLAKPESSSMLHKREWQDRVLSVLSEEVGLRNALLSPAEIEYRYIIDTFESYVGSEIKKELTLLAKQKELCFAICNFPSVRNFVRCPYSSFTNDKGVFNVQYVVDGCNKKKPGLKFSLPCESNGASYAAYYTPLKISDGYVDAIIPSAAIVSNLFLEKYALRHQYDIIAGPNYGSIKCANLVGPDYHYTQDELQIIEPYGVNCMIYRPGFGTFINANQTAKQSPKSALSSVNVRELVIYLQDAIGKIQQAKQWEFNNATLRDIVKSEADAVCEAARQAGGISVYKNVCDESNNTAEIIDNEMLVIDTHIEPGRGAGKMVHRITLYRTGGMSASVIA